MFRQVVAALVFGVLAAGCGSNDRGLSATAGTEPPLVGEELRQLGATHSVKIGNRLGPFAVLPGQVACPSDKKFFTEFDCGPVVEQSLELLSGKLPSLPESEARDETLRLTDSLRIFFADTQEDCAAVPELGELSSPDQSLARAGCTMDASSLQARLNDYVRYLEKLGDGCFQSRCEE